MDITTKHAEFEKSDKYFKSMQENYINRLNGKKAEVIDESKNYPKQGKIGKAPKPSKIPKAAIQEEEVPAMPAEETPPVDAGAPPEVAPEAATDVPPVEGTSQPLEANPTLVAQVKAGIPDIVSSLQAMSGEETPTDIPTDTPVDAGTPPVDAGAPPAPLNEDVTDLPQADASTMPPVAPAADDTTPPPTEIEPSGDDVDPKGFLVKSVQSTAGDGTVFHVIVVPGSLMPNIDEVFAAIKEKLNTGAGATDDVTSAELSADEVPADTTAMPPVDAGTPPADETEKLQEEEKEEAKEERLDEKRDPTYSGKKDWKKMLRKLLNESATPLPEKMEEEDDKLLKQMEDDLASETTPEGKAKGEAEIKAHKDKMAKKKANAPTPVNPATKAANAANAAKNVVDSKTAEKVKNTED